MRTRAIAIIRSGFNPTMRHLERTHGISIQWMHEIFQTDLIYLVYETTSKMCADIHTKAFKDHMTWKRACMLINILSHEEISSDDVRSILQPTHDGSTGLEQHYKKRKYRLFRTQKPRYSHLNSTFRAYQAVKDSRPILISIRLLSSRHLDCTGLTRQEYLLSIRGCDSHGSSGMVNGPGSKHVSNPNSGIIDLIIGRESRVPIPSGFVHSHSRASQISSFRNIH